MLRILSASFLYILLILSSSFARAERAYILDSDQEALQARMDLIQQAKKEILVEYFSVTDDNTATTAIAQLCQASKRGVKVRVLMDALSHWVKDVTVAAAYQTCRDANGNLNIEFRLFNPGNLLQPSTLLYRDHGKMLNIDGEKMITGGRNVAGKYFGLDKERNFIDIDILIEGPVAAKARTYFDRLWNNSTNVKPFSLHEYDAEKLDEECDYNDENAQCEYNKQQRREDIKKSAERFNKLLVHPESGLNFSLAQSSHDWLQRAKRVTGARFVSNLADREVGEKNQVISTEIYKAMSKAKKNILILSPYLIPTPRLRHLFEELRSRGVKITIVTNSLKSTDNILAQAGYRDSKDEMIALGIELYEFNIVHTTHAKATVIDDKTVWIGTYNLDPRSEKINREVGIIIEDQENSGIAKDLTGIIEKFKKNSLLVGKNGVPQNLELQNKDVGTFKKSLVKILEQGATLYKDQL
jgi:phosphatidylserine/phosphatidylglycerophosphate/cardiolipin synthase-like enzyme